MNTHAMPEGPDLPYSAAPAASFNHALQRTRRGRRGCNRCVPCAGSLSLGLGRSNAHHAYFVYHLCVQWAGSYGCDSAGHHVRLLLRGCWRCRDTRTCLRRDEDATFQVHASSCGGHAADSSSMDSQRGSRRLRRLEDSDLDVFHSRLFRPDAFTVCVIETSGLTYRAGANDGSARPWRCGAGLRERFKIAGADVRRL